MMSKRFSNTISLTGNLKIEVGGLVPIGAMTVPFLECLLQVDVAPGEELTTTGLSQVHPVLVTGRLCVETLVFLLNHQKATGSPMIFCTLQGYLHSWTQRVDGRRCSLTVAENIGFHVNSTERNRSAELVSQVIVGETPGEVKQFFQRQLQRDSASEIVMAQMQAEMERLARKPKVKDASPGSVTFH
jgi:hypothetical protein